MDLLPPRAPPRCRPVLRGLPSARKLSPELHSAGDCERRFQRGTDPRRRNVRSRRFRKITGRALFDRRKRVTKNRAFGISLVVFAALAAATVSQLRSMPRLEDVYAGGTRPLIVDRLGQP